MTRKLTVTTSFHYFRLVYRSALFIWAALTWLLNPRLHSLSFSEGKPEFHIVLLVIWVLFAIEMVMRFFPSPTESMGCQKQFKKNFIAGKAVSPDLKKINRGVIQVIISWCLLNGAIGALHMAKLISDGVLLLISLFYSVCDMICILFFCPFQSWMMKNRCCATCRIYNWDYLMMFTPLLFIPAVYTYSLVALALGLFIRWEMTAARHPERFAEETNSALKCINCKEKLCHHKKQLHTLWQKELKGVLREVQKTRKHGL